MIRMDKFNKALVNGKKNQHAWQNVFINAGEITEVLSKLVAERLKVL